MQLALQRRLIGDTKKWRTLCRFKPDDSERIDQAVKLLNEVDHIEWRIVRDDDKQEQLFYWRDGQWAQ